MTRAGSATYMEPVRGYPMARWGSLKRAVAAMAEYYRENPEALELDVEGKCQLFRFGPYSDSGTASTTARTMRIYGALFNGTVETYNDDDDGRNFYIHARFIPNSVNLTVVEDVG